MANTTFDSTITIVHHILDTLSHILHKASKHPNAATLPDARLYPDMYPLTDQVRLTTQYSENLVAKLTGREEVKFEGSPKTFEEFYERIESVLKGVKEVETEEGKDVVNRNGDVVATADFGPLSMEMSGARYAHVVALPTIYFHVTTAYGILRKEGVPLGKADFFLGFFPEQLAGVV